MWEGRFGVPGRRTVSHVAKTRIMLARMMAAKYGDFETVSPNPLVPRSVRVMIF
jgi:hypothetical protein